MAIAEAELQALLDKQAIGEVLSRYCRSLDRLDKALLAGVFHADAEVDYGPGLFQGGVEPFLPFALEFQGAMRTTQHYVSNHLVDLDGDSAFSEAYVYAYHIMEREGKLVELIVGARYLDSFTRKNGEWRIQKRTEVMDWGQERELTDDWLAKGEGLHKGEHSMNDLLYKLRPGL